MISIIICSRERDIPISLRENIAHTIGCEYELVIIDNSQRIFSIFQAYNEGVCQSIGDILCFCHDDIMFQSIDWGLRLVSYFETKPELGVLGVAGSHFLPSVPMYWSSSPFISEHNLNNSNGNRECFFHDDYFRNQDSIEVAVVDGLCFFMRKELFDSVRFDDTLYTGFHLYDMDICLQVISTGYKVMVCRDILIEHSWSENKASKNKGLDVLQKNLTLFCNKWAGTLPIVRGIFIPEYTIERLNRLCYLAYDAAVVRHSKAYRLGRFLLKPIKKVFNQP